MSIARPTSAPRPELLAPAGGRDALKAALLGGADAVYLAGTRFGARASAENFDDEGLAWARRVTRALERRLYVAVNTCVFDDEWDDLVAHLRLLSHLGVDAVILQDLGVLDALHHLGLALPVHLSTQAAWDGAGGAEALAARGVTRVILPRETPLDTIRDLAARGPFQVEVFVHGAHCYSVSGRCWWSAALGPRSGNRGTCAQPCRRGYVAGDAPEPWFSPRDLRALEHLQALSESGVAALKIEGRLKRPDYVGAVTRAYRAALGGAKPPVDAGGPLPEVFGREWIPGFLQGPPKRWRTVTSVGSVGRRVGVITHAADDRGRVGLSLDHPLSRGDGVAWEEDGVTRGARVTWIDTETPGERRARLRGDLPRRAGQPLRRTSRAQIADPLEGWDLAWEKEPVRLCFSGRAGAPLTVRAQAEDRSVERAAEGRLEPARGPGLQEVLPERFASLAAPYRVDAVDTQDLAPGLFLPPKQLKALRRSVVEALSTPGPEAAPETAPDLPAPAPAAPLEPGTWLRLWRRRDFGPLRDLAPSGGFLLPAATARPDDPDRVGAKVRYFLPPVFGPDAADRLAPLVARLPPDEVLCLSWEALALAPRFPEHRFRLDWTFNVANARAVALLSALGLRATASPEATPAPPGAVTVVRCHPLVSLSRFPPAAGDPDRVQNRHGDRFLRLPLADDCWGLFLERLPAPPDDSSPRPAALQLDVLLPDPQRAGPVRAALAPWLQPPPG